MTPGVKVENSNAIFIATATVAAIFIFDGFFRGPLHAFSPPLFWLFDLLKFVVVPAACLIWLARAFQVFPSQYGLRRIAHNESWWRFLGLTIVLAVGLSLVYRVALFLAWAIPTPWAITASYSTIAPDGPLRIAAVGYFSLTAGLVEEIFFRALPLLFLQRRFSVRVPTTLYVVSTALLFGAAHWENGAHEIFANVAFGVVASLLYLKLRDLWPLIGAHALTAAWIMW